MDDYEYEHAYCDSKEEFVSGCDRALGVILSAVRPTASAALTEWLLVPDAMNEVFDFDELKQRRLWVVHRRELETGQTSESVHAEGKNDRKGAVREKVEDGEEREAEKMRAPASSYPAQPLCASGSSLEIPEPMRRWLQSKQELLATGTVLPAWPHVCISEENPPLFVSDPRLKEWYEEDRNEENIPVESKLDVESLLGVYLWRPKQIIIWRKGVDCCSKLLNIDYDALFDCVLIHELGHWFNAEAHTPNGVPWDLTPREWTQDGRIADENPSHPEWLTPDTNLPPAILGDARSLSSRSYHEVWAQFFAWLYGHEKDPEVLQAFNVLEPRQSRPYQAWRKLVSQDNIPPARPYHLSDLLFKQELILRSLEWSRDIKKPVTFDDPSARHENTNMLKWLKDEKFLRSLKSQKVARIIRKL